RWSSLISLTESDWLAASALTILRRTRSWMRRWISEAGSAPPRTACSSRRGRGARLGLSLRASALATVPPRDDPAEDEMEAAEAKGEQRVAPDRRRKERERPEGHEAGAHQRHDTHRESSPRDHGGAVEQKPHARHPFDGAGAQESESQRHTGEQRHREAHGEAASRTVPRRAARLGGLGDHERRRDPDGERGLEEPDR